MPKKYLVNLPDSPSVLEAHRQRIEAYRQLAAQDRDIFPADWITPLETRRSACVLEAYLASQFHDRTCGR